MLSVEKHPGQLCGGPVGLKLFLLQAAVLALVEEARALVTLVEETLVEAEWEEAPLATVKLVDAEAWALVPMVLLGAAGDMALVPVLLAGPPRNLTIPNGVFILLFIFCFYLFFFQFPMVLQMQKILCSLQLATQAATVLGLLLYLI